MAFIERELERLYNIESSNLDYLTTVFLMEEIIARTKLEYMWDSNIDTATLKTSRGLDVILTSDEPSAMISGKLSWAQEHIQRYQNVRKFLPSVHPEMVDCGSDQGRSVLATAGVAALRRKR